MDECKPLGTGKKRFKKHLQPATVASRFEGLEEVPGRGLHSSTFELNLSRSCHEIHPEHPLIPSNPS